jgi:flavin reductase (DIM6/NTAB) family NADH-FMN oxidoreductase RutF
MARDIDPLKIQVVERYKLLVGAIVPRPIAFVSTISPVGVANLAPYSFFNGVGSDPMTLLFCPANDANGAEKDTLRNCKPHDEGGVGEFVVNVAVEAYARQMAGSAETLPPEESEFDLVGLTPAPSTRVSPPRVAESPICFECVTDAVVRTNQGAPAGGNVVIGRVVNVHVADDLLVDERYRVDPERLAAIGRMAGLTYCFTRDRFDIPWGRRALEQQQSQ